MTVTAEMIDAMVAAGIAPEQILVVVRSELARQHVADGEAEQARIERNREGNRARQAAYRARRNARNAESNGCNADNESNGVTPPKRSPTPPKTTPPVDSPSDPKGSSAPKGADRHRGTRIPTDFGLRPEARQACQDAGLTGGDVDEALAEFHDFWVGMPGVRGLKTDWLATLRNRLRETVRRGSKARSPPAKRGTGNGFLDALLDDHGAPHDPTPDHQRYDHGNVHRLAAGGRHSGR
ncbi:hypothetical protein SAMN05192565_107173 [Methylobacterium gossipiicola]|uniref:Uncharacterized protein n=1 Tax=Methylobacterium gossipiicola TaxID=582675 RepID=A0A1I2TS87_9HYPH|nr:hypothetical protein SAMN05192565_107173 [Methylobacterium gossipiicola]